MFVSDLMETGKELFFGVEIGFAVGSGRMR